MSFDFPNTPTEGQEYTPSGGSTYVYNSPRWLVKGGTTAPPATIADGDKGDIVVSGSGATWTLDTAITASINGKVAKGGDTMSGALAISMATPTLTLDKTAAAQAVTIGSSLNGKARWGLVLANSSPETGGNVGSYFAINRYDDAGAYLSQPFNINRATGVSTFVQPLAVIDVTASTSPTTGALTVAGGMGVAGNLYSGFMGATAYRCKPGQAGAFGSNVFNINWTGSRADLWVDLSNLGGIWTTDSFNPASYLPLTGGTMTGFLTLNYANPNVLVAKTASGQANSFSGYLGSVPRWIMQPGDSAAESGGNVGSDFAIHRYNDAGTYLGTPFTMYRTTGNATFAAALTVGGTFTVGGVATVNGALTLATGSMFMGNYGGVPGQSVIYMDAANTKYLYQNGTAFSFVGTPVNPISGMFIGRGSTISGWSGVNGFSFNTDGSIWAENGYTCGYFSKLGANGAIFYFYHGQANTGAIQVKDGVETQYLTFSDERAKEDLQTFDAGRIIDQTEVYNFHWKDKEPDVRSYGVLAQQAAEVYPAATAYNEKEDFWGIDYSKYVPVLLQELKALRQRVAELEGKIEAGTTPARKGRH